MKHLSLVFLFLSCSYLNGQLRFSTTNLDLGQVGKVYEVAGDIVVSNDGEEEIRLLRATADDGVRVYTSKRSLKPGDTALLVISFIPERSGKFFKRMKVFSTGEEATHELTMSGHIERVAQNDLTACYYFGSRQRRNPRPQPVAIKDSAPAKPAGPMRSIKRPMSTSTPEPAAVRSQTATPASQTIAAEPGPLAGHRPNNILILIDISSSMRDSLKLPLLKREINRLIDAIRNVDSITLVTYADSVKVRAEAVSGSQKEKLHAIVTSLKARGQTKGKKAILRSQEICQKHYISGGNNLLILASDGKFMFREEDQAIWNERQSKGRVVITTVVFGDDREAIKTLRQIAKEGDGSFIHVRKRDAGNQLLEEIRERSRN